MLIDIPYADDKITVDVEEQKVHAVLHPNEVQKKEEKEVILEALKYPIDKPKFSDFIEDGTLMIVNDATRPTPTSLVLETISEYIEEHEVEFIVATGSHRKPTGEELRWIFGDIYQSVKENIHIHDAKNDDTVDYGTTKRGTPVRFNKLAAEAEKVFAVNTVEPHYFAGFTGGRKSFLPGIASYETITENHYHSLKKDAKALKLKGNPIHEDMMEAYRKFDAEVYGLNITLDKEGRVYSASSGNLERVFLEEVRTAKRIFTASIENRSEVVVTAAYPMDLDLYQSHKAVEFAKSALKKGGIMILVSHCSDGIGPKNFYELMSSVDSLEGILERVKEEYRLGYQKAVKLEYLCSNDSLWAVTGLNDRVLKSISIEPKESLQKAIDEALLKTGGKVTFIPEGGTTVPIFKEESVYLE